MLKVCWKLCLLKCRKLRREDQEKSDWIVSRILLLRTQAVGSCSHRNLILSNFTWYLIGILEEGLFWRWRPNSNNACNWGRRWFCYQTSRGPNLINIIKCIDTNPINLNESTSGLGLRKIDTNPITLTNQRLARGSLNQHLARGSLNQRLGQAFFESLPINMTWL